MQARGFLMGGTAGRTTLSGEGLQHQDGHSHLFAAGIPNCRAYDSTFAYELAIILQDGMQRMYVNQENVFYYVTIMNENYAHPEMPPGIEQDVIRGMYLFSQGSRKKKRVQLMGSGTILREVIAAAELLEKDWNIAADVWSVPSFTELARDGAEVERWNRLHPMEQQRKSFVASQLEEARGPAIAATDYVRTYAEQIRPFLDGRSYLTLGTDGYGRSDLRERLRSFFEVNRYHVVVAALKALADDGEVNQETVAQAIKTYKIDPEKPNPVKV